MSFIKQVCTSLVLGLGLAQGAFAYDSEDVLGQFLTQRFPELMQDDASATQGFYPRATPFAPQSQYVNLSVPTTPTTPYQYSMQQQNSPMSELLNAKAALIMNANTGQILFQKNVDSVRSIASISKMMAAMVLLDANLDMNERITITEDEIDRLKGTSSRLSIGTTLTRAELLHLGLMSSENRAIHALARTYPGGMAAFVAGMNNKSRSLGMFNTRFYEPTGLDPRNVSTALDLSKMVQAATHYPTIRQLSTATYGQAYTSTGKLQQFKNSNALVREGLWNITVQKTGYIREAGRSMVLQAQMGRDSIVIVVLGSATSATRANDARTLGNMVYQMRASL